MYFFECLIVNWNDCKSVEVILFNHFFRAFNWDPPSFGHLPLLLNADGTKLSKRQCDITISYYRSKGIFPLALINLITHSGGGFKKDSTRHLKPTCYSMEELINQVLISKKLKYFKVCIIKLFLFYSFIFKCFSFK